MLIRKFSIYTLLLALVSGNIFAQTHTNDIFNMLLGLNLSLHGILNETTNIETVNITSSKIYNVRAAELDGKSDGLFFTIDAKIGVELYQSLDLFINIGIGSLNIWQNTKYETSASYTNGRQTTTKKAHDRYNFSYYFMNYDFNVRYTYYFSKSNYILRGGALLGIYVGAGGGSFFVFSDNSKYQQTELKDSYSSSSDAASYTDGESLDLFADLNNIWFIKGSLGVMYKKKYYKFYLGYEVKYFFDNLFGSEHNTEFYTKNENTSNSNIYRLSLPTLQLLHGLSFGWDVFL